MSIKKRPTKNVTLSCKCVLTYPDPAPESGEHVICVKHGPQVALSPRYYTVQCQDCPYVRYYSVFEKLTSEVRASKHSVMRSHRVTRTHGDKCGTIDTYGSQPEPLFTVGRPPF